MNRSWLMLSLLMTVTFRVDAAPPPADSILLGGKVLVYKGPERNDGPRQPTFAEAVAVRDGRIVFVGTSADARSYTGPQTTVTDLHGRMVMPGIVDGHFHGTRSADCAMGYPVRASQSIYANANTDRHISSGQRSFRHAITGSNRTDCCRQSVVPRWLSKRTTGTNRVRSFVRAHAFPGIGTCRVE